ncbi:hypothetical protein [Dactylosporangium sp. CA-139066]|uniref:hypothetical protein n=1 Tax=Dactylosporangium sp. CA-139066 TaxID=3239930 RepID=UPI003D943ABD
MRLDDLANRLEAGGDELAGASTTLSLTDPGPRTLGADGTGALGRASRDLHRLLATALTARGSEAAAHGARLAETAHVLRRVAANYRSAEEESGGRS